MIVAIFTSIELLTLKPNTNANITQVLAQTSPSWLLDGVGDVKNKPLPTDTSTPFSCSHWVSCELC